MAAGIGTTGDQQAAKALIAFLRGPAIEASLKANGMEARTAAGAVAGACRCRATGRGWRRPRSGALRPTP